MQGAFGTASYELGVPMSPQLRMPIASNTKLITSMALHQLQEQVGEGERRCGRCAEQAMAQCILSCWLASIGCCSSRSTTCSWYSQPLLTPDSAQKVVLPLTARLCPTDWTAVQGLLNISAPAADYVDLADFGLEGRW